MKFQSPNQSSIPSSKILIVGNLGYIGSKLVEHLKAVEPHCYLIGLDTGYFSGCLINPYFSNDHLIDQQLFGDVRSINLSSIPDVDSVIFLAAISNDPMGNVYEIPTSAINYVAAIQFAKHFKERKAKSFVFASSCSVYGAGGDSPKTELDDINPLTAYARSKIDAENDLKQISNENFSVTSLRFATACGTSPRLRLDLVLNDFVASALINKEINILSDGMPWRPLIDVEDMCIGIAWAKNRGLSTLNKYFLSINVGFDEANYRISDLARAVKNVLKGVTININKDAEPDKRSYRVDFSLYKKIGPSNHTPLSLEHTINQLIDCFNSAEFKHNNFRESHLIRLNVLKRLRERNLLDESLFWKRMNNS